MCRAFCLLELSEGQIRVSDFPWKTLAQELLNLTTTEWDTSFDCLEHSIKSREIVNNILSNIYFNNLKKQISESYRKDKFLHLNPTSGRKVNCVP